MNPEVFREYDIRGIVGADLDDDFVDRLARALGVYFLERGVDRVSLGMDARLSSPGFREILKRGLTDSGVHVIDLGMVPTPVMYFSLFRLDVGGGIEVTGSHNPPDNNGFKIALGRTTIYGDEIQKIRALMDEGRTVKGRASCSSCDIVPEYIDDIISRIRPGKQRLKVVVDPGNGVGGAPAMAVCNALGVDVTGICLEPDGRFPNHHPDPTTVEGLTMLRDEVLEKGADLGIGYDGDADRIGVIDARGNTVYGDMLTAILAREILKEKPGEKIIGEVKCSKAFYDEVTRAGGVAIMGRVGHSPMKARLMEEKAALAGEMSGHIFFMDRWYGFDDAIYTSARLLEVLTREEDPQEIFDRLPRVENTPEIRIECPDRIKFRAVELFAEHARGVYEDCVDIDGVRFTRGDTWGLVRPSNTQPVIVMRFEARSESDLARIERDTRDRLDAIIRGLTQNTP